MVPGEEEGDDTPGLAIFLRGCVPACTKKTNKQNTNQYSEGQAQANFTYPNPWGHLHILGKQILGILCWGAEAACPEVITREGEW